MKKRVLAIAVIAAMAAALAACGSNGGGQEAAGSAGGEAAASGTVYQVGVVQHVEHPALDAATQGFQDALVEALGEGSVEFDVQNAQGEAANNTTIVNGFVSAKKDLILANATPSLQAATSGTADIPILGTSVTDYATALGQDASAFNGTTGINVSGTSDLAPIDGQEDMLVELLPDAKQIGIIYCSAEPNSIFQAKQFEAALEEDCLSYTEYTAADSNEIQSVVTKACQESDALYVPTDNTMANGVETIKNIVVDAKIPVIAGEEGLCAAGIATLSISYYDLGVQTGKMAAEILANGADPSTMEIQYADAFTKEYNPEICEALGIQVPEGYEPIPAAE